ncbi:MAG TPA: Ig-like domain-containing protein, partial [Ohtaekwangia sp.]
MRKHYITLLSLLVCHALNPIEGSSVEKPSKNSKTNFFANPVATNDYASTPVNTPVSFNVVNGSASIFGVADSDSDGNLNIASVDINTSSSGRQTTNTTSAGSWSVDDSGVVTFTPTATFNGNATLNYRISDLTGGVSNQATILVSVTSWPNLQPNSDPFTLFTDHQRVKLYSWSDPMFSYSYNTGGGQTLVGPNQTVVGNIKFRLLPPNGYTVGGGTKYPLIVFLHGSGESSPDAPAYVNNEHQLLHGGQTHINAVRNNPVKFNGFLFYPQIQRTNNGGDNYWSPNWREAVRRVLEVLIQNYDVDRERIYIHGLSGGGEATVLLMSDFPEYFAAGHPMSAADDVLTVGPVINGIGYLPNYKHIPMRTSQGGQDGAPSPAQGNKFVNDIRTGIFGGNYMGGNVEYHYYPNLGHNTWGDEYNRPDFFSWFLSHKKNKPWVMNGQTSFCPGEPINTKIGFSASKAAAEYRPSGAYFYGKIKAYEWEKDGSPFGGNTNEITITATGSYRGRFLREGPTSGNGDDVWSDWSDPIIIDSNRGLSAAPTISTNGKSTVLPSLDGSAEVILYGTTNKA